MPAVLPLALVWAQLRPIRAVETRIMETRIVDKWLGLTSRSALIVAVGRRVAAPARLPATRRRPGLACTAQLRRTC